MGLSDIAADREVEGPSDIAADLSADIGHTFVPARKIQSGDVEFEALPGWRNSPQLHEKKAARDSSLSSRHLE